MAMKEYNVRKNGTHYPIRVNWQNFSDHKLVFMQWQHTMYTKTKRYHKREAQGY